VEHFQSPVAHQAMYPDQSLRQQRLTEMCLS
jgi:hypothetical protein